MIYEDDQTTLYQCDARNIPIADQSVNCCVTSPPYWGLRDYGENGQLGQETTPTAYVANMVEVFGEVRRVLRDDGTLWLNLGDSYANKQLTGIPWRVAFALQDDGWILRSEIIWSKPNPMPSPVSDRVTVSHETIFMLTKSARYYYDADLISQPMSRTPDTHGIYSNAGKARSTQMGGATKGSRQRESENSNKRSVWTIPNQPYTGAHLATFPPKLIEPCILAGCPKGGTVLDPFMGSGTTAYVAKENQRNAVGCDLNAEYLKLAAGRLRQSVLAL